MRMAIHGCAHRHVNPNWISQKRRKFAAREMSLDDLLLFKRFNCLDMIVPPIYDARRRKRNTRNVPTHRTAYFDKQKTTALICISWIKKHGRIPVNSSRADVEERSLGQWVIVRRRAKSGKSDRHDVHYPEIELLFEAKGIFGIFDKIDIKKKIFKKAYDCAYWIKKHKRIPSFSRGVEEQTVYRWFSKFKRVRLKKAGGKTKNGNREIIYLYRDEIEDVFKENGILKFLDMTGVKHIEHMVNAKKYMRYVKTHGGRKPSTSGKYTKETYLALWMHRLSHHKGTTHKIFLKVKKFLNDNGIRIQSGSIVDKQETKAAVCLNWIKKHGGRKPKVKCQKYRSFLFQAENDKKGTISYKMTNDAIESKIAVWVRTMKVMMRKNSNYYFKIQQMFIDSGIHDLFNDNISKTHQEKKEKKENNLKNITRIRVKRSKVKWANRNYEKKAA